MSQYYSMVKWHIVVIVKSGLNWIDMLSKQSDELDEGFRSVQMWTTIKVVIIMWSMFQDARQRIEANRQFQYQRLEEDEEKKKEDEMKEQKKKKEEEEDKKPLLGGYDGVYGNS